MFDGDAMIPSWTKIDGKFRRVMTKSTRLKVKNKYLTNRDVNATMAIAYKNRIQDAVNSLRPPAN